MFLFVCSEIIAMFVLALSLGAGYTYSHFDQEHISLEPLYMRNLNGIFNGIFSGL